MTDASLPAERLPSAAPDRRDDDPPVEPPRSWWQFSLRTMFVLVTLLVIALAWFVNGPEKQRLAIEELRAAGAFVSFQGDDADTQKEGWIPRAYYLSVDTVRISHSADAEHLIDVVLRLSHVRMIVLGYSEVSEEALGRLAELPSLDKLSFWSIHVTDAVLNKLKRLPKLKFLHLRFDQATGEVTDTGLAAIGEITSLENLTLENVKITDKGLAHLKRLPLEYLGLNKTPISDEGLVHLGNIKALKTLWLDETQIKGPGLAELRRLPLLEFLSLNYTEFDEEDIVYLKGFSSLKNVSQTSLDYYEEQRLNRVLQGQDPASLQPPISPPRPVQPGVSSWGQPQIPAPAAPNR